MSAAHLKLIKGQLRQAAKAASLERLREIADADLEDNWARLKALSISAFNEAVKYQAIMTMLAYSVGPPPKAAEETASGPVQAPLDLSKFTDEEIRAYRTYARARERVTEGASPVTEAPTDSDKK